MSSDTEPRRKMERGFRREKVLYLVADRLINATRIRNELTSRDEENLKTSEREYCRLLAEPQLRLAPLSRWRLLRNEHANY